MEEQPLASSESFNERARARGFCEGQRVVTRWGRYKTQYRHAGITIEEDFLDEALRRKAISRIGLAARPLRHQGQKTLEELAGTTSPVTLRVHHVGLDVEDKLSPTQTLLRRRKIICRLRGHLKISPGVAA